MPQNNTNELAVNLFNEICSLGSHLIVTVLSAYMGSQAYDIKKGRVGYAPIHKDLFIEHLEECLSQGGVVMLRKFLKHKVAVNTPNGPMRWPVKELYGAVCKDGVVQRLDEETIQSAHETDASTGEPREREPAIVYCAWPKPM